MNFPPNKLVDTIFTEVNDLGKIAELARAPMMEQQKINMAYLLIQNTQVYLMALNRWIQKEFQEQPLNNFKIHFCEAQKDLRCTGAPTVQESLNHIELVNLAQQGMQQAMANNTPSTEEVPVINHLGVTCPSRGLK